MLQHVVLAPKSAPKSAPAPRTLPPTHPPLLRIQRSFLSPLATVRALKQAGAGLGSFNPLPLIAIVGCVWSCGVMRGHPACNRWALWCSIRPYDPLPLANRPDTLRNTAGFLIYSCSIQDPYLAGANVPGLVRASLKAAAASFAPLASCTPHTASPQAFKSGSGSMLDLDPPPHTPTPTPILLLKAIGVYMTLVAYGEAELPKVGWCGGWGCGSGALHPICCSCQPLGRERLCTRRSPLACVVERPPPQCALHRPSPPAAARTAGALAAPCSPVLLVCRLAVHCSRCLIFFPLTSCSSPLQTRELMLRAALAITVVLTVVSVSLSMVVNDFDTRSTAL